MGAVTTQRHRIEAEIGSSCFNSSLFEFRSYAVPFLITAGAPAWFAPAVAAAVGPAVAAAVAPLRADIHNLYCKMHNKNALMPGPEANLPLRPLHSPANVAPPQAVPFPPSALALNALTHQELNALEVFYQVQFAPNAGIPARKAAFQAFIS